MTSSQKRNSYDTDMFFIIESLTIYFEKILEIMEEPLKNYSKTEWFKFKELLTSPDLSPCKCFSYANSLKLVKPSPIVKVATFNLGDLGEQSQTPVINSRKEPTITVPSLISLNSTVSPPSHFSKQQSQMQVNKMQSSADPTREQETKKTKNSIVNLQNLQQQQQSQQVLNHTQPNQLSPPQQYSQVQSQTQVATSNNPSMNSINSSPHKFSAQYQSNSTSQTQTIIGSQGGKSSTSTSNQSSQMSTSHNYNGNNNYLSPNVKQIQQTLQNLNSVSYSVQNTYTTPQNGATRGHSNSINSSSNVNGVSLNFNSTNQNNNVIVEERLRSPQLNSANYNNIYQPKTTTRTSGTSTSKLRNINQLSTSNLQASQSSAKKPLSQLDKLMQPSKTPQSTVHMKAQKSLQIDIKENNLSSRNNGLQNPSLTSSTSNRLDPNKVNNNSIGNLLNSSKNFANSPQQITTSINGQSNLLNSIGSSQNGQNSSSIAGKYNVFNYPYRSKFEGNSMTDRIREKPQYTPQMNSIRTESVFIENSSPNNNNYSINNTNTNNINNISTNHINLNQNFLNFTVSSNNSGTNIGLQQLQSSQQQPAKIEIPNTQNSIGSPTNGGTAQPGTDAPPIRKKARRETRKLSLEKFQNNIDAIQRQSELEENKGIAPLQHNKGFQQVLLNRLDILNNPNQQNGEKKRDPSPVNNRIGCDMIQGIHDLQKLKGQDDSIKENPYLHLLQKVQQRINVFKMDSNTIELISGKFTDVDETKRHRDIQKKDAGINGGFQDRVEIKRDKLKKYSVFAKKGQDQQNLKKVDDQISKDEQYKLANPQIKPKKRDEKKKLII